MIHHVDGVLAEKPAGRLIVEVGGVGMEVHVSALTWNDAGRPGDPCRLLTHLSVREDGWTLFGFKEEEEREIFRLLLGVQGIGPKAAMSILSALPVQRLRSIVADEDLAALTAVPGVGKKTASRILIDLKDKVKDAARGRGLDATGLPHAATATFGDEAVDALVALGYPFASAREAVRMARAQQTAAPVEEVLKEALRRL
jgi:Holliday junction DNA helicase RuvA